MAKTVKPENLAKEMMKYLYEYQEDIEADVIATVDEVTKKAKEELKKTSPQSGVARDTKYYKGWTIKLKKNYDGAYHKVITHLLEFGHVTRNGGRTKAIPHIRPIEQKYGVEFVDKLEEKIRRN